LDSISSVPNKMIKFYFVNKLFAFIMLNDEFMTTYEGFRNTVRGKINELSDDIYIIQTAGL